PELLKTLHIHSDELPFIESEPGLETRILQARPEEGLGVAQLRAQPGAASRLHRHLSPAFGWTLLGAWGHDQPYSYRPGSYIYETTGVVHRLLNGPAVTEAVFISTGITEWIDPETQEVTGVLSPAGMREGYLAACEAQGLPVKILH